MTKTTATPHPKPRERLSLYELGEEVLALEDLVAMDDGEWTDTHEALQADLIAKLVTKADAFGGYVANLEHTAEACKDEEARLAKRRKACESKVDRLKRGGCLALQLMQKDEVRGTLFTLAVQSNNPSVSVSVTVDKLPAAYVRIVPEEKQADKAAILAALKTGVEIEGCELVRTKSLRIR